MKRKGRREKKQSEGEGEKGRFCVSVPAHVLVEERSLAFFHFHKARAACSMPAAKGKSAKTQNGTYMSQEGRVRMNRRV